VVGEKRRLRHVLGFTISHPEVEEFCMGRTDDPDAARRQKDCDEIVVLYETDDRAEARVVADALRKAFLGLLKCSKKEVRAEESSFGGHKNYVCVWLCGTERSRPGRGSEGPPLPAPKPA
jgi:hypothetical protein